ncbi:DNA repair protein RecO [Marinicella litoralis]|uniref:DNA repair protein RecO n=1 Tax=Marinicella litoralis TaxID=644220 RepID=A0A4R6XG91_9GAMM|nr:DNA repair protein RecO [Marinicella litoralis]TDR16287.1 DNA replication and repair protein RecO [Marinicella litoralis]
MYSDQAFVLHKRPYKNSSELVKLLTLKSGLVDLISKGSRSSRSKFKGMLQPFVLTQVFYTGRSSLKTLTEVSQQAVLKPCPYKNHVSMLYCNELLLLIGMQDEVHSEIFNAYQLTVEQLQNSRSVSLILRKFEWFLSQNIGYELNLPASVNPTDFIEFDPLNGLQKSKQTKICSVHTFNQFIGQQKLNSVEIKEINHLMKSVVNHMVHGKTIQSRNLL